VNVFVAGFIGSPAMDFIRARLERENGGYATTFGNTRIQLTRENIGEQHQDIGRYAGQELILGIRSEDMEHMRPASAEKPSRKATLEKAEQKKLTSWSAEKLIARGGLIKSDRRAKRGAGDALYLRSPSRA
jgi:multiple sugar transport system ATP-binding protein